MSNNIEWAPPSGLSPTLVLPENFQDEDDTFFDEYGEVDDEHYGIVVDSGGHLTLIVGDVADLDAFAIRAASLASQAREHRNEARLKAELGTCDTCDKPYPLASREGRCGDCGECAEHCPHLGKRVLNVLSGLLGHDDVRWEYPGFLAVPLDATHEVATGQHNWESGDVQVLVDNAWEPMDEVLDFATPEDCTDEYRIAALIYGAVRRWQEAHRG